MAAATAFADDSAPAAAGSADNSVTKSMPGGDPGVAAKIGSHVIPLDIVLERSMLSDGPNATDRLINNYLVDLECAKDGVTISEAQIDKDVDGLADAIKPTTMDEALKQHHETLDQLKDDLKHARERLVVCSQDAPKAEFHHVRLILVEIPPPGSATAGGHTDAEAQKILTDALAQIKGGKSFQDVAKQVSEDPDTKSNGGSFGVVWPGSPWDKDFVNAAMALSKDGDITPTPVKVYLGYELIQLISTSEDNHPTAEEQALYDNANEEYHNQYAQMHMMQCLQDLRSKATIADYIPDAPPSN